MKDFLSEWGGAVFFFLTISFLVFLWNASKAGSFPINPSSEDDLYYIGPYVEESIDSEDRESINDILNTLNQVDVKYEVGNVKMTIPSEFVLSTTQEEADTEVEENGYESAKLNGDGSITYVVSKEKYGETLLNIEKEIDSSLNSMVGSYDLPDVTIISVNGIYTDYTITTKNAVTDDADTESVISLYENSCKYAVYSGAIINNIHIDFVNEETGRIIDSYDSNDKGRHIKYAGSEASKKSEDEIFATLDTLNKVNVKKEMSDVKMTLPPEYVSVKTQDEADKKAKENGYQSAKLNADGSATCVMSRIMFERTLDKVEKDIDKALNSMVRSEALPDVTKITVNGIYTDYSITTTNEVVSSAEILSLSSFYTYSCMYAAYSGEKVDNIHIDFVNEETGDIIDSFDSRTAGKQPNIIKRNNGILLSILETLSQINVKKGFFNVKITLPPKFVKVSTQEEADELAEEKGYSSATLNQDDSITLVMSKTKYQEVLEALEKGIDTAINKMVRSKSLPDVTKITVNGNYTDYTIITTNDENSLADSLSVIAFYTYSCIYAIYSGEKIDNIHVDFVNEETGRIIETYDANKMRANR